MTQMRPVGYPVNERMHDGRLLHIRAIAPDDRDLLLREFHRMSPTSIRNRFFGPKHELSAQELAELTQVDFEHHVALVAELRGAGPPQPAGVARFVRTRESDRAEVAVTVAEGLHGYGIGTTLLKHLARIARAHRIRVLEAHVLPHNRAMVEVLKRSGCALHSRTESGVRTISLRLDRPASRAGQSVRTAEFCTTAGLE